MLSSAHIRSFMASKDRNQDFQHIFQPKPQTFSHSQTQNEVPPIGFPSRQHPHPSQRRASTHFSRDTQRGAPHPQRCIPPGQQEGPKLKRKCSLTERDYSGPPEINGQLHQGQRRHRRLMAEDRNGFSFPPPSVPSLCEAAPCPKTTSASTGNNQRWSPSISVSTSQTDRKCPKTARDATAAKPKHSHPIRIKHKHKKHAFSHAPPLRSSQYRDASRRSTNKSAQYKSTPSRTLHPIRISTKQEHAFSHAPSNQNPAQIHKSTPSRTLHPIRIQHNYKSTPSRTLHPIRIKHKHKSTPSPTLPSLRIKHKHKSPPSRTLHPIRLPHQDRTFYRSSAQSHVLQEGLQTGGSSPGREGPEGVFSQQERGEVVSSLPSPPLPPKERQYLRCSSALRRTE
ncbi:hypothetical protein KUCAC02_035340 [Chaenocephalus aceratus]|nr:hypothetical protein KUCAC02_035340 [Chaenocephalus aceratus]